MSGFSACHGMHGGLFCAPRRRKRSAGCLSRRRPNGTLRTAAAAELSELEQASRQQAPLGLEFRGRVGCPIRFEGLLAAPQPL
jgi:hypothetical protein